MTKADDEAVAFSATTTLADTMAAEFVAPPRPGRATIWRRPLIIGVGGLIGLAIAIFTDGDNPLDAVKGLFDKQMAGMTLGLLVALVLFLAGMQWGLKTFARIAKRRVHVDNRRTNPAVDAGDPTLPMTRTYRFDETGMTSATAYDELWEGWPRITGLDETADLMIVRIGGGAVSYPLPKGQLAPELRERLQRYVDSRSSSKWPF